MSFAAPLVLLCMAALPGLYFLLRLTPPAARRIAFPPLALLRGLSAAEPTPHRLPLWLLLLRLLAAALLILGFAGPTLRPPPPLPGSGPILLVLDNGWASAAFWPALQNTAATLLDSAAAQHRSVQLLLTARNAANAPPRLTDMLSAAAASSRIRALQPQPWPANRAGAAAALGDARERTRLYLADGIQDGKGMSAFLAALHATRSFRPATLPPLLGPAHLTASGALEIHAISNPAGAELRAVTSTGDVVAAQKPNAAGNATIQLPPALLNRIARLALTGPPTAGGTALLDAATRVTTVGLAAAAPDADTPFTGALYYLRRALPPGTQVLQGSLEHLIAAKPGMILLADTPLDATQQAAARGYLAGGGILLRFAGPLTAASPDPLNADPLLSGDRRLGGALTWTEPEHLADFAPKSPFTGLAADPHVTVSQQILADPGGLQPGTVWARLQDGTPLILGAPQGRGFLVNILTTANTAWSDLALSGLYPQILRRLAALSHGSAPTEAILPLDSALDAFGNLAPPSHRGLTLQRSRLATLPISPTHPPGLYGDGSSIAFNLAGHIPSPIAAALPGAVLLGQPNPPRALGPILLALAVLLLAADMLISLLLRGARHPAAAALALCALLLHPPAAHAQNAAALQTALGYIRTGDAATDRTTADGLAYLSTLISTRSAAQLAGPAALDPATDDLAYYPLIYWPLLPDAPTPPPAACAALNTYMTHGGLLVIDMPGGDAGTAGSGAGFAPGMSATFTRVTACLALPPLVPLTPGNVLARCFYILREFPGRFTGAPVRIASPGARDADGVTPIIVAQNDWAGAWARDASGLPEQSLMPGGGAQRTLADRFGVNLVIYALTGSYKADQSKAPAILDQLGQP
jgi:hypothetical protein